MVKSTKELFTSQQSPPVKWIWLTCFHHLLCLWMFDDKCSYVKMKTCFSSFYVRIFYEYIKIHFRTAGATEYKIHQLSMSAWIVNISQFRVHVSNWWKFVHVQELKRFWKNAMKMGSLTMPSYSQIVVKASTENQARHPARGTVHLLDIPLRYTNNLIDR